MVGVGDVAALVRHGEEAALAIIKQWSVRHREVGRLPTPVQVYLCLRCPSCPKVVKDRTLMGILYGSAFEKLQTSINGVINGALMLTGIINSISGVITQRILGAGRFTY